MAECVGRAFCHCMGAAKKVTKHKIVKIRRGLRCPPYNILYTTTNQKQAAAMEGSMEERCNERDAWGKCNTIVLGGIELVI